VRGRSPSLEGADAGSLRIRARASKERTAVAQDEGAPRRRGESALGMRAALEGEEVFAKVPVGEAASDKRAEGGVMT
jgi:hypothetical protein